MASKADFTEDEWNTIHRGVTGAGMLVALSERGFASTFKESGAMAKYMAESRANAASQLVRELAAEKGTGWKVASKPEDVREGTLAALQSAKGLLQTKSADDVEPYRAFVLGLCHAVSDAGKGGDEVEAAAIEAVTSALDA